MIVRRVHLVGCLGNGMVALARLYRGTGIEVTGCDARVGSPETGPALSRLAGLGVHVVPQQTCDLQAGADLLVHTLALPAGHRDLVQAAAAGVPVLPRVEALIRLLPRVADKVVAVSGVTGKTTVTGLVAQIYQQLGRTPAAYIGGEIDGVTDRAHPSDAARIAVVEACEVQSGMLRLPADVAVVTSSYWGEHPVSYPTVTQLEAAFAAFVAAAPAAVIPWRHRSLAGQRPVITFGDEPAADVRIYDYHHDGAGFRARARVLGTELPVRTEMPGRHSAGNLAAALATHVAAGTPVDRLGDLDLAALVAPRRRIELIPGHGPVDVYDDFGHNPVQIQAALDVLNERYPGARLGAFLQPAGYERIHAFGMAYAAALEGFDRVQVAPPLRTFEDSDATADESGFADRLVRELRRRGTDAEVRPLGEPATADLFGGCAAVCAFSILPVREQLAELARRLPGVSPR